MELQLLEQKIWILVSVIAVLWVIMIGLFSVAIWALKVFVSRILNRLEELIKKIQDLQIHDTSFQKDIENVNNTLKEHKEEIEKIKDRHLKCKNI